MAFVVDNSIAVAWSVSSQADRYSRLMIERARREDVHAPHVWPLEFLNALRMLERRGLLLAHQVDGIVARIAKMQIRVDTTLADNRALIDLSRRLALSIYDASYLEFAQRRGLPLATKDKPMRDAALAAGVALA
jgi:predicted nucleic acid-binding protein